MDIKEVQYKRNIRKDNFIDWQFNIEQLTLNLTQNKYWINSESQFESLK